MSETDFFAGRIRDLADKAFRNDFTTHTDFLSASEQASLHDTM